jgi:hypothetical protein
MTIRIFYLLVLFCFACSFATPVFADSISAGLGVVRSEPFVSALYWNVMYRHHIRRSVAIEPAVAYWNDLEYGRQSVRDITRIQKRQSFNAGIHLLFVLSAEKFSLAFGGGPSLHHVVYESRYRLGGEDALLKLYLPSIEFSSVNMGAQVTGSIDVRIAKRWTITGGVRTDLVRNSQDTFQFFTGFRFKFNEPISDR